MRAQKLRNDYELVRTGTTLPGKSNLSPFINTTDPVRKNTVVEPKVRSRGHYSFNQLQIKRTLNVIKDATNPPHHQEEEEVNQPSYFAFETQSLPEFLVMEEADEVTKEAHSDGAIDFGIFVRGHLDYFGAEAEEGKSFSSGTADEAVPASGRITIENFRILKPLSKGAYGTVVLAEKRTTKDLYAIKIMNAQETLRKNQMELLRTEKDILNSVNNEFVVHGAYSFKDEQFLYIAMEYMPGGDLAKLLDREGRFEWWEARFYLKQIVQALEYMRSMEYVHRDLKPDNILLDKTGDIKLTDFGLSRAGLQDRLNNSDDSTMSVGTPSNVGSRKRSQSVKMSSQRILGTPNYMSPEVIKGKEHSYGVDYWSLGVIAYEMIVGVLPFPGETV